MFAPLANKQATSVHAATHRLNVWEGSVRSSKTISSLVRWLQYVRTGPAGNLVMVGKTERTLKRNVIDPLVDMLGPNRVRHVSGAGELWILDRRIYLAGANDARSELKIRGMTLAGAYVDEASVIPHNFWSMLTTRLSVEGAQLFATTNPDAPTHWLKKDLLDRARTHITRTGETITHPGEDRLDLARFSFQLDDNPHLAPDYVSALKKEHTGLWYRRFILGEWAIAAGAIYDMWDPERHVVPAGDMPRMERVLGVGVDHGTRNPFSAIMLGYANHRLWLMGEWRYDSATAGRQLSNVEYSKRMRDWIQKTSPNTDPEWIIVDPSAADFKQQLFIDGRPDVINAVNDVVPGIQTVSSLLATGRLLVSDACTGFIAEAPGYVWDEGTGGNEPVNDRPIKQDDHSLDAARYAVHTTKWTWQPLIEQQAAA